MTYPINYLGLAAGIALLMAVTAPWLTHAGERPPAEVISLGDITD